MTGGWPFLTFEQTGALAEAELSRKAPLSNGFLRRTDAIPREISVHPELTVHPAFTVSRVTPQRALQRVWLPVAIWPSSDFRLDQNLKLFGRPQAEAGFIDLQDAGASFAEQLQASAAAQPHRR